MREGHGSGEGRGASPGELHDTALKAAETDATKRALATFGKPFGLALYGVGKSPSIQQPCPSHLIRQNPYNALDFIPMIQRQSQGRRVTTAVANMRL
jgi:recombination DNA repair RAD52 pathway protein